MQLMPSTLERIRSRAPDLESVDDPELNIAAGIKHDRALWVMWPRAATPLDRRRFMFASYNAGLMTILRARRVARRRGLDPTRWASIEAVSRDVAWRQRQTKIYLRRSSASTAAWTRTGGWCSSDVTRIFPVRRLGELPIKRDSGTDAGGVQCRRSG
jgi:membrane-bound lytic murein transglycosylase MltF